MTNDADAALARAFRDEWGRVVASIIAMSGDWDLAEDCAQHALSRAAERWRHDGIPRNPGAWLTTTARNHALNILRRRQTETAKLEQVAVLAGAGDRRNGQAHDLGDDRLALMFTCCHPALPLGGRVALTLRAVAGLTTAEIARAFLVSESTMAQRLVRAKRKMGEAGIPCRVPPAHLLGPRTSSVLGVVYLVFTEGYAPSGGTDAVRGDLCAEAIRLGRLLAHLMPETAEVLGLLALMLLQDSRRAARQDAGGDLVTLEEQDRTRWDASEIREGLRFLDSAQRLGGAGPYQVQAAIAACHATANDSSATDWHRVVGLYDRLAAMLPTPVVALNRAVAVAMAEGPAAGLEQLDALPANGELDHTHLLPAVRADFLRRLDRRVEAADSYRRALELARTEPERRFLARRLHEVTSEGPR